MDCRLQSTALLVLTACVWLVHFPFAQNAVKHVHQTFGIDVPSLCPQVPLQLIECAECRDMFQLHVTCKDCKVIRYDQ